MKKTLVIFSLCCCMISLMAQHETLFSRVSISGAFGAPIIEMNHEGAFGTAFGGGGALALEDFFIGGYGIANADFEGLINGENLDKLELAHGGFWLGYAPKSYKLLHFYTSARIGWGVLDVRINENGTRFEDLDKIFVMTPEIGIELNVTSWFRISGTVGYRWVRGIETNQFVDSDQFNGAISSINLRFGGF